ncbi:hypothetical protein [Amaricoccus sp.]|nr:hypothetical protein [Amaricoccus sp.]
MGGASAPLRVEESVGNMRRLLAGLDLSRTGSFPNHDGRTYPW